MKPYDLMNPTHEIVLLAMLLETIKTSFFDWMFEVTLLNNMQIEALCGYKEQITLLSDINKLSLAFGYIYLFLRT